MEERKEMVKDRRRRRGITKNCVRKRKEKRDGRKR